MPQEVVPVNPHRPGQTVEWQFFEPLDDLPLRYRPVFRQVVHVAKARSVLIVEKLNEVFLYQDVKILEIAKIRLAHPLPQQETAQYPVLQQVLQTREVTPGALPYPTGQDLLLREKEKVATHHFVHKIDGISPGGKIKNRRRSVETEGSPPGAPTPLLPAP